MNKPTTTKTTKKPKPSKPAQTAVKPTAAKHRKLARLKPIKRPAFTKRKRNAEERVADALSNVPRITNETVAEHREDVLKAARKYIYPLEHSRHRVVRITIVLLVLAVVIFFGYCGAALYKFQSTNGFIYGVTRVIPFPVAKSGPRWISYESYLFELRRNMHYYETQQQSDFATRDGKVQLKRLKQQALTQVTQDAYVKQLAEKNKVSVSQQSVDNQVSLVRSQNRLGSNDRVFKDVLNQFWGWSIDDFKRELRGELLQQAVVAKLDSATQTRADAALQQLKDGGDFAAIATASSEDPTTVAAGGQYPNAVTPTDRDIAPQVTAALFRLQPGQTSGLVSTGYTLEIVKVIDREGTSLHGAHIQFNYQPITTYTKPLAAKQKLHTLVKP